MEIERRIKEGLFDTEIQSRMEKCMHKELDKRLDERFDEECEERIFKKLNAFAELVSKNHNVPLRLLIKDIPCKSNETFCKGLKINKKRCSRTCNESGFCGFHFTQKRSTTPMMVTQTVSHNHTFPPMFSEDCPACQQNKLIEVSAMIHNEQVGHSSFFN